MVDEACQQKLCSQCKLRPRIKRQSFCRPCYNQYVKEYRDCKRIEHRETPDPGGRPRHDDIPDAVRIRVIHAGTDWGVAVRDHGKWYCVFTSSDREEALLVLGAALGFDIRGVP